MHPAGQGLSTTTESQKKPPRLAAPRIKQPPRVALPVLNAAAAIDRRTLKANYLNCLHARSKGTLRQTVEALIQLGVTRELLLIWAVSAGHERKHVAKLLSECLCGLGLRLRRPGAGRRPGAEALLLLALARELFGERCRRVLRAALRACRGQSAFETTTNAPRLIPDPELYGPAIRRFANEFAKSERSASTAPRNPGRKP